EIAEVQQKLAQYGYSNVVVNSFCTYSPLNNYNTVSGNYIYDGNLNGCTVNDSVYPALSIMFTDGVDTGFVCGNKNGVYEAFVDARTFDFTPMLENPLYFTVSPLTSTVTFPNNNNILQTQDYCIVPNGVYPDMEVILLMGCAVPGFDAQ